MWLPRFLSWLRCTKVAPRTFTYSAVESGFMNTDAGGFTLVADGTPLAINNNWDTTTLVEFGGVPQERVANYPVFRFNVGLNKLFRTMNLALTLDQRDNTIDPSLQIVEIFAEATINSGSITNFVRPIIVDPTVPDSDLVLAAGGNQVPAQTLIRVGSLDIGSSVEVDDVLTFPVDTAILGNTLFKLGWDGFINFVLVSAVNPENADPSIDTLTFAFESHLSADSTEHPRLITDEEVTNTERRQTGISGPDQAWSRADECPVCGFISLRETWVRDPNKHILVCPLCRDDLDPDPRPPVPDNRPGVNERG